MKSCPKCAACYDDGTPACPKDGETLSRDIPGPPILDGKYRLEARIGQGGMGTVYRGWHLGVQRRCAIKVLHAGARSDPEFLPRFRLEARALGRLRHPGIVDITDFGVDPRDGGLPFLVMEHLEGRSLKDLCIASGPLPLERALPILEAMAEALDFAHARGVLHRDLKPANVWLCTGDGSPEAVKILDFGIALLVGDSVESQPVAIEAPDVTEMMLDPEDRLPTAVPAQADPPTRSEVTLTVPPQGRSATLTADYRRPLEEAFPEGRLTLTGQVMGTPGFIAPEILAGRKADARADVYSFGALAYVILTGCLPFHGTAGELLVRPLSQSPVPPSRINPSIPVEAESALLAALDQDPVTRPMSARALTSALRAGLTHEHRRAWRRRELPRRLAAAAVAGLVVAAAGYAAKRSRPLARIEAPASALLARLPAEQPPDARLNFVLLDEAALAADPRPLAARADEFAERTGALFRAGALGVAIDLLLPVSWSESEAFSRLVLENADRLVLAAAVTPEGSIVGRECLSPLTLEALGPNKASRLFGLVNIGENDSEQVLFGRIRARGARQTSWESWAQRAASIVAPTDFTDPSPDPFWIEARIDLGAIPRVSWADLDSAVAKTPGLFRGRLVMLGATFAASGDAHRIAGRSEPLAGVYAQALLVDTILAKFPRRDAPPAAVTLAWALGLGLLLSALLCLKRVRWGLAAAALIGAAWLGGAAALSRWTGDVVPTVTPIVSFGLTSLGALGLRAWLAPFPEE